MTFLHSQRHYPDIRLPSDTQNMRKRSNDYYIALPRGFSLKSKGELQNVVPMGCA